MARVPSFERLEAEVDRAIEFRKRVRWKYCQAVDRLDHHRRAAWETVDLAYIRMLNADTRLNTARARLMAAVNRWPVEFEAWLDRKMAAIERQQEVELA